MRTPSLDMRVYARSAILDTLARNRLVDPAHIRHEPTPRRGMFDGIRLNPAVNTPDGQPGDVSRRLDRAVRDHARALQDAGRMTARNLQPLEYQKAALARTREALDAERTGAAADLGEAFARNPALAAEAANGRTAQAIRAMQLEAEVRADPELRADRFVQAWRRHMAERERLKGWEHDSARGAVEGRMKALAKSIDKDPAMAKALGHRGPAQRSPRSG